MASIENLSGEALVGLSPTGKLMALAQMGAYALLHVHFHFGEYRRAVAVVEIVRPAAQVLVEVIDEIG